MQAVYFYFICFIHFDIVQTSVNKGTCVTFGTRLCIKTDCFFKGLPQKKMKLTEMLCYNALGETPIMAQKKYRYISSIAIQLENIEI